MAKPPAVAVVQLSLGSLAHMMVVQLEYGQASCNSTARQAIVAPLLSAALAFEPGSILPIALLSEVGFAFDKLPMVGVSQVKMLARGELHCL